MTQIIIGTLLIASAGITAVPGVIDSFYERSKALFRIAGTDGQYNWSRRLARIWVPPFLLLLGVVFVLGGAGLLD